MFSKDFKEFVELLIKHKVDYLVVGGYAVGIHGHPRYTGDLDIWLNVSDKNAQRILAAVNEFGFASYKLSVKDFTKANGVIQLGYPPLRIDLLNHIDGVTFNECFKNKKEVTIEGVKINFISYNDLLRNKRASNRPQDIADLDNLQGEGQ